MRSFVMAPSLFWLAPAALLLCPALASADVCGPPGGQSVAPGVVYHDCSDKSPPVHVVTIDRDLPDVELRVMGNPIRIFRQFDPPFVSSTWQLTQLDTLAQESKALVA